MTDTTGRPSNPNHLAEKLDTAPPPEGGEQRHYARYRLWFPVTLRLDEGEPREVWGICRDVSVKGLMMSATIALEVDTEVEGVFRLAPEQPEHTVRARVVRAWRNADELLLAFPFRIAIEFGAPVPALASYLEGNP